MTPWPEVTPGSIVQGKDGQPWTVESIQADGATAHVTIRNGERVVTASPTGSVLVLKPGAGPKPVSIHQERHDAVDAREMAMRARRLTWLDELPEPERQKVLLVDRIFSGEWEDQGTDAKNWLIPGDNDMSELELIMHLHEIHSHPAPEPDTEHELVTSLRALHRADHQRLTHGRTGYVKHTHDPSMQGRYELLCGMAEAGVLYATKQRNEAETHAAVLRQFGGHPDAGWLSRLAIDGQRSGFELHACNVCHQVRQTKPPAKTVCKMTPGCKGKLERIQARPRAFKPERDPESPQQDNHSEVMVTIPRSLVLAWMFYTERLCEQAGVIESSQTLSDIRRWWSGVKP